MVICNTYLNQGREWPPGSPWPWPQTLSSTNVTLSFDPANFRIVLDVPDSEKCDPLDFAVSKYNNAFLFPAMGGFAGVPDPGSVLVPELRVTLLGDVSGNTECQNHPRLSEEDFNTYEHCKTEFLQIVPGIDSVLDFMTST